MRNSLPILLFVLLAGCAPSAAAVQAAILQTQAAGNQTQAAVTQTQASLPAATPTPLPSSAPVATSTVEPTSAPVVPKENSVESIATYTAQVEARWKLKENDGAVGTEVEIEGCVFAVQSVVKSVTPNEIDLLTDKQAEDWWPDPKESYVYGVEILVANKSGSCPSTLIIAGAQVRLFVDDGHNYGRRSLMRDEDYHGMTFSGKPAEQYTGMIYFEVPVGFAPIALQWDWLVINEKAQIELPK